MLHEETGTETALVLRSLTVFIGVHCVLGDGNERLENAHVSSWYLKWKKQKGQNNIEVEDSV